MPDKDNLSNLYFSQNDIFADLFNYAVFNGQNVVQPDNLKTENSIIRYAGNKTTKKLERDILKSAIVKSDENYTYLLLGLEIQTKVDYTMPVRSMLYDAFQYHQQITEIQKNRRKNKTLKTDNELVSGILKTDRIKPVITLVFYLSPKKWDGPRSIHEMLDTNDPYLLSKIPDYKMNLISCEDLSYDQIKKMPVKLKQIFTYIKYFRKDKQFLELTKGDPDFIKVDKDTYNFLDIITDSKLQCGIEGGFANMYQGVASLHERMTAAEMTSDYMAEIIYAMNHNHNLSLDEALKTLDIPEQEAEEILAKIEAKGK